MFLGLGSSEHNVVDDGDDTRLLYITGARYKSRHSYSLKSKTFICIII